MYRRGRCLAPAFFTQHAHPSYWPLTGAHCHSAHTVVGMGAALDAPAVLVEAAGCFDYSFACWLNLCLAVFLPLTRSCLSCAQ